MRLFLALDPDNALRVHIARAQQQVLEAMRAAGLEVLARPVRSEQHHMTLLFLGEVEESRVEKVVAQLQAATMSRQSLDIEVGGIGAFPDPKARWLSPPRVLWLGARDNGAMRPLHLDLIARLGRLCPNASGKILRPHFTLARLRQELAPGHSWQSQTKRFAQLLDETPGPNPVKWTVRKAKLIRSTLTKQGPVYETLAVAPFDTA